MDSAIHPLNNWRQTVFETTVNYVKILRDVFNTFTLSLVQF